MDVLQYERASEGQTNPQVTSELSVERRPAEHGTRLLFHQLERGLPGITVKAPRRCHERKEECGRIAIFRSQPQPERMPVEIAECQCQALGERVFWRRLEKGNAAAGRVFER